MSIDMTLEALVLKGEKISIDSPSIARESAYFDGLTTSLKNVTAVLGGSLPVFCGAVALWAAPASCSSKSIPKSFSLRSRMPRYVRHSPRFYSCRSLSLTSWPPDCSSDGPRTA